MDDAIRDHLLEWITVQVQAGRTPRAWIADEIAEMLSAEGVDDPKAEAWLGAELDRLWAARVAESKTWPRPTDVDRLAAVFDTLGSHGFLTTGIDGSAFTQSDVQDDLREAWHEAGGPASGIAYYLGCHEQDIAAALQPPHGLYLMFGRLDGEGSQEPAGRIAADALKSAGFDVDWDGTAGKRIHLRGFQWRADLPPD